MTFILIGISNILLMLEILKKQRLTGADFKKEQCTLVVILIFYELGYGIRFFLDEFVYYDLVGKWFAYHMLGFAIAIFEGASLLVLLLYHNKNFKQAQSVDDNATQQQSLPSNISQGTVAHLMMIT